MRRGHIYLYHGEGRGKTTIAIGQGIRAVGEELNVIMIQFLDYNNNKEYIPLKNLEPAFKIFRFEKIRANVDHNNEASCKELKSELQNAFNFSKKIMETGECDILILDGILDAVSKNYICEDDLYEVLGRRPSYMDIILTGETMTDKIGEKSDFIYNIYTEKKAEDE